MGESVGTRSTKVWLRRLDDGEKFAVEDLTTLLEEINLAVSEGLKGVDDRDLSTLQAAIEATTQAVQNVNGLPATLGQKPSSGSTSVVLSQEQEALITSLVGKFPTSGPDPDNSTQVPLGSGLTFNGQWKRIADHGSILAFVLADQNFTAPYGSNVCIQWSNDGVTPNGTVTAIPIQSTVVGPLTYYYGIAVVNAGLFQGSHYRIHEVDGATAQGINYVIALLSKHPSTGSIVALNDPLSQLSVALLTRTVQAGLTPDGAFTNQGLGGLVTSNSRNSIATPGHLLTAGQEFVGPYVNIAQYAGVTVFVDTDQDSTDDGLKFEFSPDGVTAMDNPLSFTHRGSLSQLDTGGFRAVARKADYVRIRYKTAANQGRFILRTFLITSALSPDVMGLDERIGAGHVAGMMRAIVAGRRPTSGVIEESDFRNQQLTGQSPTMLLRRTMPSILLPNHVFESEYELNEGYTATVFLIAATPVISSQTFQEMWVEVSDDGVNPILLDGVTPQRLLFNPIPGPVSGQILIARSLFPFGKYWKFHIKNPAGGLSAIYGDVVKSTSNVGGQTSLLSDKMRTNQLAQAVSSATRFKDTATTFADVADATPLPTKAKIQNAAGTIISPRLEDGHGSAEGQESTEWLSKSNIMAPVDIQAVRKVFFAAIHTTIAADDVVYTPVRDIGLFSRIEGVVRGDEDYTLILQVSRDQLVWIDLYPIHGEADTPKSFQFPCENAFGRLRIDNGPAGQTSFSLDAVAVAI